MKKWYKFDYHGDSPVTYLKVDLFEIPVPSKIYPPDVVTNARIILEQGCWWWHYDYTKSLKEVSEEEVALALLGVLSHL